MDNIRSKAELYQVADQIREQLGLHAPCTAEEVYQRIIAREDIGLAFIPLNTWGLQGMSSAGENGERDIILLSDALGKLERGFYAAHELIHLTCHRDQQRGRFYCFFDKTLEQDDFLEWQANEGAAQIVMPMQQFLPEALALLPNMGDRTGLLRMRLKLAAHFGVTDSMVQVRLESLKYELYQAWIGQEIASITPLSAREQQRMGITVPSLNDRIQQLWQKELNYHRRLRDIDI